MTLSKKQGFYTFFKGYDIFIISTRKNITSKFIETAIKKAYDLKQIDSKVVDYMKDACQKATLEHKIIESGEFKGLKYINISGEDFGGCGDENTKIIELN